MMRKNPMCHVSNGIGFISKSTKIILHLIWYRYTLLSLCLCVLSQPFVLLQLQKSKCTTRRYILWKSIVQPMQSPKLPTSLLPSANSFLHIYDDLCVWKAQLIKRGTFLFIYFAPSIMHFLFFFHHPLGSYD